MVFVGNLNGLAVFKKGYKFQFFRVIFAVFRGIFKIILVGLRSNIEEFLNRSLV